MNKKKRTCLSAALAAAMTASLPTWAVAQKSQQATSPVSQTEVILTISGAIRAVEPMALTRQDLEALPRATIRTTTPWHDGVQVFEGVALQDLIGHVGARGSVLKVTAINAYRTDIPVADAARHRPILAWLRNGSPMSVRDKGPLFVIYPYDANERLRTEEFLGRSAWQVRSISVE